MVDGAGGEVDLSAFLAPDPDGAPAEPTATPEPTPAAEVPAVVLAPPTAAPVGVEAFLVPDAPPLPPPPPTVAEAAPDVPAPAPEVADPIAVAVGTSRGRGVGEPVLVATAAFQPVPGAQLIDDGAVATGPELRIYAPAGTPVHAVVGGVVVDDAAGVLSVRGDDRRLYRFSALSPTRTLVRVGQRVGAGEVLGAVAARGGGSHLELGVQDPSAAWLDPYLLLVGLTDPNDLGSGGDDPLVGVDPDGASALAPASAAPGEPIPPVAAAAVPVAPAPPTPAPTPAPAAPAEAAPDLDRLRAFLVADPSDEPT